MPRALDAKKAEELTKVVEALDSAASFRNILRETAKAGLFRENKTLRRYLDALVAGRVLGVRVRDVGSVNLQQLYSLKSKKPEIFVGLSILHKHGLNWHVPESDKRLVSTGFDGLARSHFLDTGLMASLEDCLIHELYRDARSNTGAASFVIAMISTRKLDLAYLMRRADELHVGKATRLLLKRILEITSSARTEASASVFFEVRERFLKIARQYAQSGLWKLVDEIGVGNLGLQLVRNLTESDVIMAAGKQLGVTG